MARHLAAMPWEVCGLQEVLVQQRHYLERRMRGGRWYGVGRQDGSIDGEQAAVVVRGESLQVLDWQTRWLSDRPDTVGSVGWDARLPRVATVMHLRHPRTDRLIGVLNTHLDHAGEHARQEAARLIGSWVSAEPDTAWIVMGDLNATPASAPLQILEEAGLDSVLDAGVGGTEHGWTGRTDRNRIDHILIDKHWDVLDARVDYHRPGGVLPSDHWPVRAVLVLRR